MMKVAVALALLGVTLVASTTIPSLCTTPTAGGTGNGTGFTYDMCSDVFFATEYPINCPVNNPVAQAFTYTIGSSDQGSALFFVLYPVFDTDSPVNFQVATSVPGSGLLGSLSAYSQTAKTSDGAPANGATSNVVGFVDSKTTWNADSGSTVATFTVTCTGYPAEPQSFMIGFFRGGALLSWSSTGPSQGVYGATIEAGVPCCGAAQVSWALSGVATQHLYIDAELTVVAGRWASATMINVGDFSLDDTQPFNDNGDLGGVASIRTCVTNQSCTTSADTYFINALASSQNTVDGWVTLEMTLKASAGAVGMSLATIAAVVIANLL